LGRLLCNLFIAHLELERLLVDIRLHLTSLGLAIALECNHLLVLRRLECVQRRCVSLNLSLVSLLLTSQLQFVSAFLVHDLLGLVRPTGKCISPMLRATRWTCASFVV